MAAKQRIRGLFSEQKELLPRAREDASGLRPMPRVQSVATAPPPATRRGNPKELFEDLPTDVYEPVEDHEIQRGLADLLEPAAPPAPPGRRPPGTVALPPPLPRVTRRRGPPSGADERIDFDAAIGQSPPRPAPESAAETWRRGRAGATARRTYAMVILTGLAAATLGVAAFALDLVPRERQATASVRPPAASGPSVRAQPREAAPDRIVLDDVVISVPIARLSAAARSSASTTPTDAPTETASTSAPTPPVAQEQEASTSLPEVPSREQVVAALRPLEEDVRACAAGHEGVAQVRIAVHSSGRVTTATVTEGPVVGTSAGSCIASALRRAQFPRFQRDRLLLQYPFRL